MGATLPLVIKSSERQQHHLGEHIGVLYGSNTAGAIVGTVRSASTDLRSTSSSWRHLWSAAQDSSRA
jgi:hypothetical protein